MIVVTIIGILGVMAKAAFERIVVQVRGTALMNDFRVFAAAYGQYAHVNGAYPASYTKVGGFPNVMNGLLPVQQWSAPTPIGGYFAFQKDVTIAGHRYRALLRVKSAGTEKIKFNKTQMQRIDKNFDDGNLGTGQFFTKGAALTLYYVIEP